MAKLKISDYSSTSAGANLNTDINSIDIDEGCAPSGINNAIRTLMAQVKDFQTGVSGDGLTLGGALSGTSATFSGALSGTSATFSGDLTVDTDTLYVDSTNNKVGIGNTSPNTYGGALNVTDGTTGGETTLVVSNTNINQFVRLGINADVAQIAYDQADDLAFGVANDSTTSGLTTEYMRIDSSGNVGIGTTSPSSELEVASAAGTAIQITGGTSNSSQVKFADADSATVGLINYSHAANSMGIHTNGSEKVTINSDGDVGIGVTSPNQELHIQGTDPGIRLQDSDGTNQYTDIAVQGGVIFYTARNDTSNGQHLFRTFDGTTATERMRINASGNVGINNSSPATELDVDGDITADKVLVGAGTALLPSYSASADTNTGVFFPASNEIGFATAGVERLRIDATGLAIGTTVTGARLRIRGAGTTSATVAVRVDDSTGSIIFYVRDDGRIYTGTSVGSPANLTTANAANMYVSPATGILFRSTSSIKYKTDVQDATHGLDDVMKLRAVNYKGKSEDDGDTVFGGLIAEEVHDAGLTEFVQYDDDGNPDALAYGHMVSLAFKAIQELKAELDAVKSELNTLKGN